MVLFFRKGRRLLGLDILGVIVLRLVVFVLIFVLMWFISFFYYMVCEKLDYLICYLI